MEGFTALIQREGNGYVALCPELDVASQGDTVEQAHRNLAEAVELFLETASPAEVESRLPESLHKQAKELAEKEGVSLNQLLVTALAEKLSALMTDEYLSARAERGSRAKFDSMLGKVRSAPPPEGD